MKIVGASILVLVFAATAFFVMRDRGQTRERSSDLRSAPTAPLPEAGPPVDGEVRKLDRDSGRITLKHGEIVSLGMPAMTMVFQVHDERLLDNVQVGSKVKFSAQRVGGTFVVTALETAN